MTASLTDITIFLIINVRVHKIFNSNEELLRVWNESSYYLNTKQQQQQRRWFIKSDYLS